MENLIKEITQRVVSEYSCDNCFDVTKNKELTEEREISVNTDNGEIKVNARIWTKAIKKAVSEHDCVFIPNIGEDIYIDDSIILHSGSKLIVDKAQKIILVPNTGLCMVRNENLIDASEKAITLDNPDCGIVVDGGIWDSLEGSVPNGNHFLRNDKEASIKGAFAIMLFSNVKDIIIKNCTMCCSRSYAVQICNCEGAYISDIEFVTYHKDGIHVNGPIKYGIVRNLTGKNMGDDMIAFNAWDWPKSAMSFGSIEKMFVENVKSEHNEYRLLPGRKTFSDGSYVDCDIRDCVIRNIEGVYTFKLYGQPYYADISYRSETVGNIVNVHFDNIKFPEITNKGFSNLPVGGLFEVCSDTDNLHFDNIQINNTAEEFKNNNSRIIKVGPLSATWKWDANDPSTWTEVFSPDDICTLKNTHIGKISFKDRTATADDYDYIVKATAQTINEDYPNTTPKGGTGYGIIENVIFD